jgi:hypothetical protein
MCIGLSRFRPVADATSKIAGSIRLPHGCLLMRCISRALSPLGSGLARESTMPTYRAYLIDRDNRVSSYRPIHADTDAEALTAARQFAEGCDVEVWHLDRKIGRLERAGNSGEPF